MEANFSDKKTNLLHDLIKNNDNNKEYNLSYLKNYFFSPTNLPQLPQFKKKVQFSYLETNKDRSKVKNLIIKNFGNKRDVFRQMISESIKAKEKDETHLKPSQKSA